MLKLRAAFCAALILLSGATALQAQDVTLVSPDGGVSVEGTLLGFDGEFYRVDTVYGELTVDGSGVRCEGPGCPSLIDFVPEVRLSGSTSMASVMLPGLIRAYAQRQGWRVSQTDTDETHTEFKLIGEGDAAKARFIIRRTNTDEGFADLLADEADIALAQREIRVGEADRAREIGLGDMRSANRSRVLALDALVPIVAAPNPIREISVAQLAHVLGGQIDNWKLLGGPDAPITLHLRESGSGAVQNLQDRVLSPARLQLSSKAQRHQSDADLSRAVAADRLGLGIVGYSDIGGARPLPLTGPCGFALRAQRLTIKTEDYPLTVPMFLYLPARRLPKVARDFLRYSRSTAAQIVIRRSGFVDQSPEEIPVDAQGNRFANAIQSAGPEVNLADLRAMTDRLRPFSRLSTSFRFDSGSSRLDAQSRSNVRQLARALQTGTFDNRSLLFVGFSDGVGPAAGNRKIADQRARAVRDAVVEAAEDADLGRTSIDTEGYGEALPMACDDSSWGRNVNRRVEVWVR